MKMNAAPIGRLTVDEDDRDKRGGYFRGRPVEQMSLYMLRESICSHRHCAACMGCEYGKEWVKRGYPEYGTEEYIRFFGAFQLLRNVRDPEKRTKMALERMKNYAHEKRPRQKEAAELHRILKENGIKIKEVAEESGYTEGTLSGFISKGISKAGMQKIFSAVERILERRFEEGV